MANSESIRHFMVGREAVTGTPCANANLVSYPFLSLTHTPKKTILQPKEIRGTRVYENTGLSGVQMSETKAKVLGYYDILGHLLSCSFNVPTRAANDTSASDWTFKSGLGSVPSHTLNFSYGVGTAVEIWEAVAGGMVEQIDFTFASDKLVEVDLTWVSPMATVIATPTISAFSVAAYIHPFGQNAQASVTALGGAFGKLISGKVSLKNNRTPLYTVGLTSDPSRFIEGQQTATFDLVVDYTADASSFYNNYRTNTLSQAITYQCQDTVNLIGTTPLAHPTFSIAIPKPRITSANLVPNSKGNTEANIKGTAEFDTGTSSVLTAFLTNMIVANGYDGH